MAIYDEDCNKLVSYTYDAWGNFTRTYTNGGQNTAAANNPFTYRGYYYDYDLKFYYLNSRYYDPYIGRFINADGYISTGLDLTACNMFAYCGNNPPSRIDENGDLWVMLTSMILISATLVCTNNFLASQEQKDAAIEAARKVKINDEDNANVDYSDSPNIIIDTESVMREVDLVAYSYFYDEVYTQYTQDAYNKGISQDDLMSKYHIMWEFHAHILGTVLNSEPAKEAHLDPEETPQSLLKRAIKR